MTFHKILCPIDFSPGSQRALATAVRMARVHAGELILLHAWMLPAIAFSGEFTYPPEVIQELADDAQHGLDAAVAEARQLGAERVTGKLVDGPAWQSVVDALEADPRIDLIVIGSHGRTGIARVALGSVAEAVVRHATIPVLTVRGEAEPTFRHILCPVDFSPASHAALDLAVALAQPGGKGIELLHVVELPVAWGELRPFDVDRELSRLAARRLTDWSHELVAQVPVAVSSRICVGRPSAELLATLDADRSFDLVVMGSRGRTGLARFALGSVAEKVVRHAHCPVLVTHGAADAGYGRRAAAGAA